LRVAIRRNTLHTEFGRSFQDDAGHRNIAVTQRFAELLARGRARRLQGIVGVHAQHQVHATFQVETELELVGLEVLRQRHVEALGEWRLASWAWGP
jgi:hypothetical protein